jgi:transcriptional regulator with XRE-family HTH domain
MTSPESQRRAREFEIDRLCARYVEEVKSGRKPNLEDYLTRYPDYALELADFIVTYHLTLADMPEPDETPVETLSPGFARALEAIRAQEAAAAPAPSTASAPVEFVSLEDRSFDVGLDPEQLAARVGVSPSIIARLDARAIKVASIPRELFRRLAETLDVTVEAVMGFLGASAQTGGAFYYADQAPTGDQDEFLAAIEASDDLDPARKAEWRAISASDRGE